MCFSFSKRFPKFLNGKVKIVSLLSCSRWETLKDFFSIKKIESGARTYVGSLTQLLGPRGSLSTACRSYP